MRNAILRLFCSFSLAGAVLAVGAGLLAGCASPPAGLLELCGQRTVPPQPPKSGTRTLSNITAWANQVQLAREATDRTLADCADKHAALVEWVRRH